MGKVSLFAATLALGLGVSACAGEPAFKAGETNSGSDVGVEIPSDVVGETSLDTEGKQQPVQTTSSGAALMKSDNFTLKVFVGGPSMMAVRTSPNVRLRLGPAAVTDQSNRADNER